MNVAREIVLAFGLLTVLFNGCDRSMDAPEPRDVGDGIGAKGGIQAEPIDDRDSDQDPGLEPAESEPTPTPTVSTGVIEGTFRFTDGTIPTSTIIPVAADLQFCGHEKSKEDYVIDAGNRGVRYVIVHLESEALANGPRAEPEHMVLDNKDCRFEPHAAVLTLGSTIEFTNSDLILHTTHGYFAASFNFALPKKGSRSQYVVRKQGLIQVRCDRHGWMNAFIQVDRHPFHAVTDARGRFRIAGVPAGEYTLSAWHERFGPQEVSIIVRPGETTTQALAYPTPAPN